jgi:uncharacterized phage-associated protein
MTYQAINIANWFINQFDRESGDNITHLKVQKLLYFSQAWYQVLKNEELFAEEIEAWAHGPVVREVFNEFKENGWNPLSPTSDMVSIDKDTEDVLTQVLNAYGDLTAKTLENMTHQDDPWKDARAGISPEASCSRIMPKDSIKEFFIAKYNVN